ncbi:hypothetical protein [Deferrisoma palaeochoriense]
MNEKLIETIQGPTGVVVELREARTPYGFENLLEVKVTLVARIPGAKRPYRYELRRLGVGTDQADEVVGHLAGRCRSNLVPYLFRASFPERYRAAEERERHRVIPFGPARGRAA